MLSKDTKIKILENFYALDYAFFGKPITEIQQCCLGLAEEYISIKGAISSVLIELYKLVDFEPAIIEEKVETTDLLSRAKTRAIVAREMCHKLIDSDKGRASVKSELREALDQDDSVDINEVVDTAIRLKAFKLAADNLLIASTISESANYEQMNEWAGRLIEDSYKILRDSLAECAVLIISDM